MENRIREGKARDVMTEKLITGDPEETLGSAVGKMRKGGVSEIPIVDEKGELLGLINYYVLVKHRSIRQNTKVRHVMISPPDVEPDTQLVDIAEHLIFHDLRAIPVIEKGKLVGIVSRTDVIGFLREIDEVRGVKASDIMSPEPNSIHPKDDLATCLNRMRELDERTLPVVEGEKVVGVVGIVDISKALLKPVDRSPRLGGNKEKHLGPTVRGLMNPPITVEEGSDLGQVMDTLLRHRVSMVPVVKNGLLIGVVTQYDLMEFVTKYRPRDEVLVQITGLEAEPEVYDMLHDMIGRHIERTGSMSKPETIIAHIIERRNSREEARGFYEIRLRHNTNRSLYTSKRSGWDLVPVLEEGLEAIEKQVRRDHERRR